MTISFKDDAVVQTAIGLGPQEQILAIFAGAGNPWDEVVDGPQFSHYYKTDGTTYIKTGPGFTIGDWTQRVDSVFGSFSQYEEGEAVSSTISAVFIEKIKLTTPIITAGTYRIEWAAEIKPDDGGNNSVVTAQVQVDDTTVLAELESQIDDVVFGTDMGHWAPVSGFREVALSNAAHFIDMDYKIVNPGGANIRRARLSIIRVA